MARILGPEGYGTFYFLMAIVAFLDNPVTGWANACRKRLTEKDVPSGEAVGSTIAGIVIFSVIVFVGSWVASPLITAQVGNPDAWLLLSLLFVGMVSFLTSLEVLKATEQFGSSSWVQAGRDVVRVLAQAALVASGMGVAGMVGGMVVANLVVAPIVIYLVGAKPEIPSKDTLRSVWEFAKSSIPNGVVATAQSRMDVILLGLLVGQSVVGNYEVALRMTMPAMYVAGIAQGGLMGRISNRRSKGEEVITDIQNNLSYVSIIAIPLFFGALTVGRPVVVTAYSSKFAEAGVYLAGLAFFRAIRSQKSILVSTLDGIDRPELNLRVSTFVFVFNLTLGIGLLYTIGPFGVVVATVVSEAIAYVARAYFVRSLMPSLNLLPRPLLEQFASGVLMAAVTYAVRLALPLSFWPYVALVVGIGGVVYFSSLLLISEPFRTTIRALAEDAGLTNSNKAS
ncbi:oligosaccharide flippase family protein [Halorussus pelagicus]|uniref:oligosaccharide flippase family protein n=1 Tax=Halorussus pelagicus TaxID=2505977 RepID=UPI00140BDB4F|nr:oligosaccharide flippase family protein [Halorussus pelagicus]